MDTTQAETEVLKEKFNSELKEKDTKLGTLEEELQKYKKKEEDDKVAAEKEEEEKLKTRITALEEEKETMKVSFEEKLDKISQRASTPNSNENTETLSKEKYLADREKYDTIALKEVLKGTGVFNE